MWWLLACAVSQEPETAPAVESWEAEGQLVVDGLERVESFLLQGQRESAYRLAERVYTDRWEPRLERATTLLDGPDAALRMEYAFGQLLWELSRTIGPSHREPPPAVALDRIAKLESEVKEVAKRAQAAYPPPGKPAEAPVAPAGAAVVVPDAQPAWTQGTAAIAPVAGAKTEAESEAAEAKKSEKARASAPSAGKVTTKPPAKPAQGGGSAKDGKKH